MPRNPDKPHYEATEPERIPEKVRECHFFLDLMASSESGANVNEEFLFYYSAFLCGFRTLAYRLGGVIKKREGSSGAKAFWHELDDDRDIAFVTRARDLEVHGNGFTVWSMVPGGVERHHALVPSTLVQKCQVALVKLENVVRSKLSTLKTELPRARP